MAKVAEDAVVNELPLNDERAEPKRNSHTAIALRHMVAQRDKALSTLRASAEEVERLNAAIAALG